MIARLSNRTAITILLCPLAILAAYAANQTFAVIIFSGIVPLIVVQALLSNRIYSFFSSSLALIAVIFCTFPYHLTQMVVDVPSWVPSLLYWPFAAILFAILLHQLNIAFLLVKGLRRVESEMLLSSASHPR